MEQKRLGDIATYINGLCNSISDKNKWHSPVKDVGMTERSRTTMEEKLVNILNEMAEYLSIS